MIERAKVVLNAAVTYLVLAGMVLTAFSEELAKALPEGAAETVGRVLGVALLTIATAVAIIRRVTPVLDSQKGLLPK